MASSDYDRILIECCACCLSLDSPERIEVDGEVHNVCPHCGSTEVAKMTIDKWDLKFQRKYNLGRYLDLPKGMTWEDIMAQENKETYIEENTKRMVRNREADKLGKKEQLK